MERLREAKPLSYGLCYPEPYLLWSNVLHRDINAVYGDFSLLPWKEQVPGIAPGCIWREFPFHLHDRIYFLGRHAGIDDAVFALPQVKTITDR